MASFLPGRSDNHIKNRWNGALKKLYKGEQWFNAMLTRDLQPSLEEQESKVSTKKLMQAESSKETLQNFDHVMQSHD